MKIKFFGAAQTVTGSQYLLEINQHKLLLECGMFQGRRKDFYERNQNFFFDPRDIDAVILSHAHIDHSGNLPNLVKQGYENAIYTTPATAGLADIMLRDAGHIQEADAEFVNKKREKRGEPPIEPLYTIADAAQVAGLFQTKRYNQSFEPIPGVIAHLVDSGHILGSSSIVLDIEEKGHKFRLWFSGDVGREKLPLLNDPVYPNQADYLMLESTYGDKLHRDPEEAYLELKTVVDRTIQRNGKVIIPAFAVGRTQELVYDLNRMMTEGEIPAVPVYVDSPLAVNTTSIFQKYSDDFDEETKQFVKEGRHPALSFPQLTYIQNVDESKALNDRREPMIIISASGMAETGRILHHLRNNIQNPRNTILIVSWQAPDTLGRRLADREKVVRIFGELYDRRAEVATIGGFSAHAGQNTLLKYALATKDTVKKIFLIHGEEQPAMALKSRLMESGFKSVEYPKYRETVVI